MDASTIQTSRGIANDHLVIHSIKRFVHYWIAMFTILQIKTMEYQLTIFTFAQIKQRIPRDEVKLSSSSSYTA